MKHYQKNVLLYNKNKKRWEETRVNAYKRFKNTIEPLERLLKELGW